jgi:hypothetical protein
MDTSAIKQSLAKPLAIDQMLQGCGWRSGISNASFTIFSKAGGIFTSSGQKRGNGSAHYA